MRIGLHRRRREVPLTVVRCPRPCGSARALEMGRRGLLGVQLDRCVGSMPSSNLGCQVTGTTLLLAVVWLLSVHNQMSHSPRCPTVHQSSAENG